MDADVESFLDECRADPWFREQPGALDHTEEMFEKLYREGDESAKWQEVWDRIREIVTRKVSLFERFKALFPILQEIRDSLD
jgi:hypothetical protein